MSLGWYSFINVQWRIGDCIYMRTQVPPRENAAYRELGAAVLSRQQTDYALYSGRLRPGEYVKNEGGIARGEWSILRNR
jgi:hypothetical protein